MDKKTLKRESKADAINDANYRRQTIPNSSRVCGACDFAASGKRCTLFDFVFTAGFVCDDFKPAPEKLENKQMPKKLKTPKIVEEIEDVKTTKDAAGEAQADGDQEVAEISDAQKVLDIASLIQSIKFMAMLFRDFSGEFNEQLDRMMGTLEESLPNDASKETATESVEVGAINLQESMRADMLEQSDSGDPVELDIIVIEPGWGNTNHNNYYSKEMLHRDAHIFNGVKMFATDHVAEESNVRNWVGTIVECGTRFTETGAPIARVVIHNGAFANDLRNLDESGLLEKMANSIVANGRVEPDFEEGGRKGNLVKEITDAQSVDFVSEAGAGGKALELVESAKATTSEDAKDTESEDGKEGGMSESANEGGTKIVELREGDKEETAKEGSGETEETTLAESVVREIVGETSLPDAARSKLIGQSFDSQEELQEAIKTEAEYIDLLSGGGKPFTEKSNPASEEKRSAEEIKESVDKKVREANKRNGFRVPEIK